MYASSDGKTRDLVTSQAGAGWDFSLARHPYHNIERPLGPHYCVYNRRQMACCFDKLSTVDGYWHLRRGVAVLHTGELPLQFKGPDAERLLDLLFTKDISKVKPGRCGYGIACYEDGGLLVDGVLLRLSDDTFWYAQADGDFYSWARAHAHARGMDVAITDPRVFVSQVQGPKSMQVLADAADDGMPDPFNYFGIARVKFGGQEVVITRTGYTNELGWEFYTEAHHDADALWAHLSAAGEAHGMVIFGLDSMHIRRIEAGIMNAGSDFDYTTTPFDVDLSAFVDMEKEDFIGRDALLTANTESRRSGLLCDAEPHIGGEIRVNGERCGRVTAGAFSPYLQRGIGIALMDTSAFKPGMPVEIGCIDGKLHQGELAELPLYDKACEIPRGKRVDVPDRC